MDLSLICHPMLVSTCLTKVCVLTSPSKETQVLVARRATSTCFQVGARCLCKLTQFICLSSVKNNVRGKFEMLSAIVYDSVRAVLNAPNMQRD